ncbi:MAG: hypothetical protein AAF669_07275 [Pseudomonadota bacterium]
MQQTISLLRSIAPTLAQVLDSPFHPLATKYIRNHLPDALVDAKAEDEAQIQALLSEPAGLHALKNLDQQFASEIKRLELNVRSVDDAKRTSLTVKPLKDSILTPQFLLSLLFVGAYFCVVITMFAIESSDQVNMRKGENSFMNELQILLGALTAGVGQVLSFWFGRGQDKKPGKPADDGS